jgi:hypothetical protein
VHENWECSCCYNYILLLMIFFFSVNFLNFFQLYNINSTPSVMFQNKCHSLIMYIVQIIELHIIKVVYCVNFQYINGYSWQSYGKFTQLILGACKTWVFKTITQVPSVGKGNYFCKSRGNLSLWISLVMWQLCGPGATAVSYTQ